MSITLAEKLARAGAACRYVQKDKRNTAQSYNYVSDQAVTSRAMSALAAEGVAVTDVRTEVLRHEEIPTRNGSARYVLLSVTVQFSDGTAAVSFQAVGSGMDSGDKAAMKAMTAARKYALLLGLGIASGDDPEADERTDAATAATTPAQPPQAPRPAEKKPAAAKAPVAQTDGNAAWGLGDAPASTAPSVSDVVNSLAECEASAATLREWYQANKETVRSWTSAKDRALMKQMLSDKCREIGLDIKVVTS